MVEKIPQHLAIDGEGAPLRAKSVPLVRRVPLTMARLLRSWSGRLVFAAGLVWLPLGASFLRIGADQDLLLPVSLGLIASGCFLLVLCGWKRYDDPTRDPRKPGVWGYWDWRPDAGLVGGACLVAVGLGGVVGSVI